MKAALVVAAIAAIVGGVGVSLQAAVLANLGRSVGSLRAGLLTYATGGALAAVLLFLWRGAAGSTAAWNPKGFVAAAAAGAMGFAILAAIAYSTERLSVAAGLAMFLVGQSATAVLLDSFGIGGPVVQFDWRRAAGLIALALGTYLLLPPQAGRL